MTASTLTHRYEPRGVLIKIYNRKEGRAGELLVAGPAGTGKSRACMEKLHHMALLNPGMRGLIVRKTLASLGSTALVTWRQHVAAEALAGGVMDFYGGSPEEPPQYRYSNGSMIAIGGMDKSIRIMSSEYDVVYAQEATELTEGDWEAITSRLRNGKISFQQLIADCNPDTPTHWLKVRCDAGHTVVLDSRHEDNPILYNTDGSMTERGEAYMAKLDKLTGVRYQRLRKGLWVAAEGIIYEDFDPAIHLIDRFEVPEDWPRYWSIDFGFTNPFVCQFWAEDPDGRLFMYREIYHTKRLVEDHAERILELVTRPTLIHEALPDPAMKMREQIDRGYREWTEPRPREILCDHDAEDRATLTRHLGMPTKAAPKAVSPGIQAVAARWRVLEDGKARLYLMRDAVVERDEQLVDEKKPASTAEEVVGYVWKVSPADVKAGRGPKEEPEKKDDHGQDAKRYLVARLDLAPKASLRVF